MTRAFLAAALGLLLTGLPAGAAEALRGIKGADQRIPVNATEYPWSAIGRLNNGQGAYCSGALIGPRLMLTAAHCLWNPKTRDWMPVHTLHFLAGYHHGEYVAHATVTGYTIGASYSGLAKYAPAVSMHDWALVALREDIGTEAGYFGLMPFGPRDLDKAAPRIFRAGYSQDRPHVPMAHLGCGFAGRTREGQIMHSCDAVRGDSGSPLFVWRDGGFRIVAIHVSTVGGSGAVHGGAVGTASFFEQAEAAGAPGTPFTGAAGRTPVSTVQLLLSRLGFDPGPADGSLSDATKGAIRRFQRTAGAPETAAPSVAVLGRLFQSVR